MMFYTLKRRLAAGSLLSAAIILFTAPAAWAAVWASIVALTPTSDGAYRGKSSAGYQSDGKAHVAFEAFRGGESDIEITYATNKTGAWRLQRITKNSVHDQVPQVSADMGKAHVIWRQGTGVPNVRAEVLYKNNVSGSWSTARKLSNNSYPDDSPDIAVAKGKVHAVWTTYDQGAFGDGDIYYKTNASGSWRGYKVSNNDLEEDSADITLGSIGGPHIVYTRVDGDGDKEIIYAYGGPASWRTRKLTSDTSYDDDNPSITLYGGKPYIVFTKAAKGSGGGGQIWLATNASGRWLRTKLTQESGGIYGKPRIDVVRGKIHIAYTRKDPTSGNLNVYYRTNASGKWRRNVIDSDPGRDSLVSSIGIIKGLAHITFDGWSPTLGTGSVFYRRQR